jgi:hypothetical protein
MRNRCFCRVVAVCGPTNEQTAGDMAEKLLALLEQAGYQNTTVAVQVFEVKNGTRKKLAQEVFDAKPQGNVATTPAVIGE